MTWNPGQSGNPGGRVKTPSNIRELAREMTPAAMKALGKALNRPTERVAAAKIILEFGWGKPQSTVNVRMIHSVTDLSDEELRAIAGEASDGPPLIEHQPDEDDDEPG